MENYESLKLSNQLCFPLYAASREVVKKYRPLLDAIDLTYTQYITMMVMWEKEKISVKNMGAKLFLDSGTLTPVLKNLEKKGLITRKRWEKDERILMLELTKEGLALKDRAADIPAQIGNCISLAPDEAMQLYTILYKILDDTDLKKE